MTETTTPSPSVGTPSPTPSSTAQVTVGKPENPKTAFTGMALDMSWRLALAVLIPIIGGYELDSRLGTTPLVTVLGFLLAMVGAGLVMWRTLQVANDMPAPKVKKAAVPTANKVIASQEKRT